MDLTGTAAKMLVSTYQPVCLQTANHLTHLFACNTCQIRLIDRLSQPLLNDVDAFIALFIGAVGALHRHDRTGITAITAATTVLLDELAKTVDPCSSSPPPPATG